MVCTMKKSIASYKYYTDFEKVVKNVEQYKIELNILNALVGSKNIEKDFEDIVTRYPETLKCIPLLMAVRKSKIYINDLQGVLVYNFSRMNYSIEQYKHFMRETGLFEMLQNHIVSNLVDYAFGVETGLDSHSRKNRGGDSMEDLVEKYIIAAGFVKNINYFKEMKLTEIKNRFGLDLSVFGDEERAEKKFDFVVRADKMIYGIETNFYTGHGSKLNETARSYKMLYQEAQRIDGFKLVWITDGIGWTSAKDNLRETFNVMETVYNINDLEKGLLTSLLTGN